VTEVVELDQVDAGDPHPLERAVDRLPCAGRGALAGLRREEEAVAVLGEPGAKLVLGVAVARSSVDVVDPVLEQEREGRLRLGRRRTGEGDGAEHDSRARMPGASEGSAHDRHGSSIRPPSPAA
jgi:hypothetical protein